MPKKGYKQTLEHKQNISKSKKGHKPTFTGPHTEETKRKIRNSVSKSMKEHEVFKETKQKISKTESGKIVSKDVRKKN